MIEYGEILPQSVKELDWFNSLPKSLQKKLKNWTNKLNINLWCSKFIKSTYGSSKRIF